MPVAVTGLADLQRAFAQTERATRLGVKAELREIARPIQSSAETNAGGITRIGPKWPKMRIGVSRSLVYVAPRQRGVKVKGGNRIAKVPIAGPCNCAWRLAICQVRVYRVR